MFIVYTPLSSFKWVLPEEDHLYSQILSSFMTCGRVLETASRYPGSLLKGLSLSQRICLEGVEEWGVTVKKVIWMVYRYLQGL